MAEITDFDRVCKNELYCAAFHDSVCEKKLTASRCVKCGAIYLPPRPICPACRSDEMEITNIKGRGRLVAFTIITAAPPLMIEEGYGRGNPYCSGIVLLDEGVKITARILGVDLSHPEEIKINSPVTMEFQEAVHGGAKCTFVAFRLVS